MKRQSVTGRAAKAIGALLVLVLTATACGSGGSTTDSGGQAAVTVGGIESGCAEAIELTQMLSGGAVPNMNADDMRELADGANSLSAAFPDRPSEVGDYINLVRDVTRNAADSAAEQSELSAEQARLLLDFELAGRRADFDRLSPGANEYFSSACGDSYDNTVAALAAGTEKTVVASADEPAEDTTTTTVDAESAEADTITTEAPVTGGEIIKDLSSVGATGTFLGADLVVGEIWRTNLTAESAIMGGAQELGEQSLVLVQIRLTTNGYRLYGRDSEYGFVSADGFRTNASDAFLETGESWDLDLDENESKAGYLVFEGGLGDLSTGTLQWVNDGVPSNIKLGKGPTTQPYPVELPASDVPVASSISNTYDCVLGYEVDVRDASVELDAFGAYAVARAGPNERIFRMEFAVDFVDVTGEATSCQFVNTLFVRNMELRLLLDNSDSLARNNGGNGSVEKGATEVFVYDFVIPDSTTSFELVDITGTVLASWSDLELPEP